MKELHKNPFHEELLYDERRKFFVQYFMENVMVFNAMLNLQLKGKENIEKIEHLIESSKEILEKQKEDSAKLRRLLSKKYQLQKKTDIFVQKINTK